ncbi:unnamed protein product [Mytilus coruscus]|uniref:Chromo domain-containing protein n=1 Tax=Mytilus coruscus TaxID=42192 RepID=A0A6J8DK05_MYTCO|nr:unnamed protein product [Mytilus coruscus]
MDPTKILAKFKGDFTENPSRWWKLFENFVNLYWEESKFCNAFPLFLEENAQIWFNGLPEDVTDTRENLKCEFLKKYQISHGQNFQKLSDFIDLKQQETESVAEYINRVNALSEDQDVGQFKLTKLQYKCKPELVRLMSLGKWPETVEEAEVRLRSVEANFHYLEKCEKKETEDKIILELKPKIDMMFQQISAVNSKSLQQPTASPPMVEPLLDDRKAKVQHRIRTPRRQRRRNPCYRCVGITEVPLTNGENNDNSICFISLINDEVIPSRSEVIIPVQTVDKSIKSKIEQKQRLMVMLGTNRDVFAINLSELDCTDLHPHRIDTGDAAPVRQRFYRQSPAMKTESSKHIKEMLNNNIIEPSQSEWASPVCLVRKKGSTSSSSASNQPQYRFCIDFRQLNLLCVKRVYPIVQMDDIVDMLGEAKAKFYSTVDMFNGYHQIKLDPETKHKTAFTCHEGVFEFNRLPFGLSNSPHTFQLVMSEALRGINWKSALGTANGNADALSRRPYGTEIVTITTATVESSTQTEATFIELDPYASICEITTSPKEKIVNDQRTDENFKDVIKYILDKELPDKTRQARKTVIESQDYIIDDDAKKFYDPQDRPTNNVDVPTDDEMSDDEDNEEKNAEDADEIVQTDTQPDSNDPIRNNTQVQRHTNDDRNNDDSDLYLVERIVKAKRINNKMHYYIKWLGFGNRSNSWEPEENIPPELRHEFKVRMDQTKRIKVRKTKR